MNAKSVVEPNAIYTRAETAMLLGISMSTLKQIIRGGHLKVSQPTGIRRVFIQGASILEMLEQTVTSPFTRADMQSDPVITKRASRARSATAHYSGSPNSGRPIDKELQSKEKAQEHAPAPVRKHKRRASAALGGASR